MKTSDNLNFNLPELSDGADITKLSDNWRTLDETLYPIILRTNVATPDSQDEVPYGVVRTYSKTGQAVDGTMTQKAITENFQRIREEMANFVPSAPSTNTNANVTINKPLPTTWDNWCLGVINSETTPIEFTAEQQSSDSEEGHETQGDTTIEHNVTLEVDSPLLISWDTWLLEPNQDAQDNADLIETESRRAKQAEGDLSALHTETTASLVAALNEVLSKVQQLESTIATLQGVLDNNGVPTEF